MKSEGRARLNKWVTQEYVRRRTRGEDSRVDVIVMLLPRDSNTIHVPCLEDLSFNNKQRQVARLD